MHIVVLTTWGIWQYIFYMLSSEDILEFLRSALHRITFISAVKNTRGLYLGNLTLTKIQSINSETPCVHVDRCSETYEWYRSINLIGHIWHPYFSEHTGIAECVRVSKNLQSKSQQQNYLLPELFWGMSGVDLKKSQPFATLGYLEKSERFTGKIRFFLGWTCYTCENTSLFSRKSRVLHTFEVCVPTGVYKRKGGPRSSHYFAFSKVLSTIYVYGDGNTTCDYILSVYVIYKNMGFSLGLLSGKLSS